MSLTITNSLTRRKETFTPLHEGHVGIYVCGPTVYGDAHIGHAKSYVSFDVIVRYLRYLGYKVLYVQNITDVGHLLDDGEDRVLKKSRLEQVHPMQIAERYTRSYFEDMDAMGVLRPDISPRATGHISEQIEMVKRLLDRGYAYEVNGSVYFDVARFEGYGKLSGRSLDDLLEGTRVEVRSEKRHPADFALWKRAEPEHIMRWPSPWGEGFPGWHLECSAMSMKYLGDSFDIHGGGMDNQFPHHECEIAQSEGATGKPFVKYWIHNNLVTVGGQKMSKSLNNFVTLKDAFRKFHPLVLRFFVLQSHYRSTLDFSDQALAGAAVGLQKFHNTVRNLRRALGHPAAGARVTAGLSVATYRQRFLEAMDDDFNTPQAIAVLFQLVRELNQVLNAEQPPDSEYLEEVDRFLREAGGTVLGILPDDLEEEKHPAAGLEEPLMQVLIEIRNEARAQKLWALADMIRDRLKSVGIVLEDKREGTVWRRDELSAGGS
jgi:cysteinyl-tRNA synthetase